MGFTVLRAFFCRGGANAPPMLVMFLRWGRQAVHRLRAGDRPGALHPTGYLERTLDGPASEERLGMSARLVTARGGACRSFPFPRPTSVLPTPLPMTGCRECCFQLSSANGKGAGSRWSAGGVSAPLALHTPSCYTRMGGPARVAQRGALRVATDHSAPRVVDVSDFVRLSWGGESGMIRHVWSTSSP